MSDDPRNDILTGLYTIRQVFEAAGMKVPTAILLADHDEGLRLMHSFAPYIVGTDDGPIKKIVHPDGSTWMHAEIMGISVRWPANLYATEQGYKFG